MKYAGLLVIVLLATQTFAQQKSEALLYLEVIGAQFNEMSKDMMSYTSAASHGKGAKKVEKKRQELLSTVKEAENNVRKLKAFNGSTQLRDSVVAYFKLSHLVLLEDYGKIVDLEEIAEQSYDAMEAYLLAKEKATDKLDASYAHAEEQYSLFAKDNNIKLIESESKLSQKLETSGKVHNYYNQVYLVFFKSFKDEAYLMDALDKEDVNALEQTKSSLATHAGEGLEKLKKIGLYGYDATLSKACQQLLVFYQQEATKVDDNIDFFLKKEQFEKIKKAFDTKKSSERTQADVDQYNKTVNEFNNAVNRSNTVSDDLNKRRADLINQWNKTTDVFLAKYVPKYR